MDPYRLPTTVVPTRYDLRLEPDLVAATFAGHVVIAVTIREAVVDVWLNAAGNGWSSMPTSKRSPGSLSATKHPRSRHRAPLPADLSRASARLGTVAWSSPSRAPSTTSSSGFYRRSLQRSRRLLEGARGHVVRGHRRPPLLPRAGTSRALLRLSLPSTLVLDPVLKAISNTRIVEEQPGGGPESRVRFADTGLDVHVPGIIPSVAQAIWKRPNRRWSAATPLRVWCVPEQEASGEASDRRSGYFRWASTRTISADRTPPTSLGISWPSPTSPPALCKIWGCIDLSRDGLARRRGGLDSRRRASVSLRRGGLQENALLCGPGDW